MKTVEVLVVEDQAIVAADLAAQLRKLRYKVPAVNRPARRRLSWY
jgi:CheY-like chemotaxis protein